jgi:hypothetical protein
MCQFWPAFWWRDSNMYLVFSTFISRPTSLLASLKSSVCLFIVSMLFPSKNGLYYGLIGTNWTFAWLWEQMRITGIGKMMIASRRKISRTTYFETNPTWVPPGLKPNLSNESTVTNGLGYGMTMILSWSHYRLISIEHNIYRVRRQIHFLKVARPSGRNVELLRGLFRYVISSYIYNNF